jgi:hypothetical protein
MPRVVFEPMVALFGRAETIHALDRATVINLIKLQEVGEKGDLTSSGSGTGSTQPREYN